MADKICSRMQHQLRLDEINCGSVLRQQAGMHAARAELERAARREQRCADHAGSAADHRNRTEQRLVAVVRTFWEIRDDLVPGQDGDAFVHFSVIIYRGCA